MAGKWVKYQPGYVLFWNRGDGSIPVIFHQSNGDGTAKVIVQTVPMRMADVPIDDLRIATKDDLAPAKATQEAV